MWSFFQREEIVLALNLYQDAVHPLTLAQRSVLPWNVQFCLEINTLVPWLFIKVVGRVIWCKLPENSKEHGSMNFSVENTTRHLRRKCIRGLGWKEVTALIVVTLISLSS